MEVFYRDEWSLFRTLLLAISRIARVRFSLSLIGQRLYPGIFDEARKPKRETEEREREREKGGKGVVEIRRRRRSGESAEASRKKKKKTKDKKKETFKQ